MQEGWAQTLFMAARDAESLAWVTKDYLHVLTCLRGWGSLSLLKTRRKMWRSSRPTLDFCVAYVLSCAIVFAMLSGIMIGLPGCSSPTLAHSLRSENGSKHTPAYSFVYDRYEDDECGEHLL